MLWEIASAGRTASSFCLLAVDKFRRVKVKKLVCLFSFACFAFGNICLAEQSQHEPGKTDHHQHRQHDREHRPSDKRKNETGNKEFRSHKKIHESDKSGKPNRQPDRRDGKSGEQEHRKGGMKYRSGKTDNKSHRHDRASNKTVSTESGTTAAINEELNAENSNE